MDEQQVSVVLLAINKVKEAVDDMRKSVDDLRMNLKEMRKALNTTTALLKHFENSENKVPTEAGDVIRSNVASNTSKVAVVDRNGETSCEWKFGVVKYVLKSRLTTVCENDSVNVLSLFVSKMASGSWCYIQPLVIAAKPPPKPPDASLNMLGQTNQVLSIVSKISRDMFKSIRITGSSKMDAASTKCLIFVSWFISVYIIELSRFHLALTECVKSGVSALLDVVALVGSIDEYGIRNTMGLKNGDKDEISCYFRHRGNNQWLFAIVVRPESKLLCSVKLERATGNTLWFSRLQTNAIFNELCKMFDLGEPSFVPQKEKGSFVIFVSLQGSGKTATWARYSYYHQKIRWKTDLVFAAILIVFSGCLHYAILSVADCLNFSGLNLVLFMLTNGSTEAALLISYWAATMTGIVNFIEASMERCSCVLLIRNYYYFELQIFGHDQRFFWIHRWSLVVGDAWLCKLNCKSSHIFYHYTIGNMQGLSSMVLLMGEPSELMFQGFFSVNVISTLVGVLSKSSIYWLLQKTCIWKLKIVAELYKFFKLKDEAMITIKDGVDDMLILNLAGIHCESLGYGCRQATKQYHIFTNGWVSKCITGQHFHRNPFSLFMPFVEADEFFQNQAVVLSTSPTGQHRTQGTCYDYYSHQNPFRQLQTQVCSHFMVYCARVRGIARCTSLETHVMQQRIGSNDQQPLLGATGMTIFLSNEVDEFSHAPSYIAKAEPLAEASGSVTFTKLQILAGLTYLETKKHELVANKVLQTGIECGNNYSELIAPRDVVAYTRLCALASFGWTELKNKGVNNSNFKNSIEFVTEAWELVYDFFSNHYTSSLEYSGDNKSNVLLDINQSDHMKTLYEQVHEKAVIQCVYHFMFVDMRMQANACRATIGELKKEIEALITDNQTQARSDSHNQVIFKRNFAWNLLASVFTRRHELLMFSLPRPPEVNDLEDKVVFKGRRM